MLEKKVFIYEVEAFDRDALIGKGQHKRAIVDEEKFMEDLR